MPWWATGVFAAIAALAVVVMWEPYQINRHSAAADAAFRAGRYADAIPHYDYLVRERPDALGPQLNLARCLLETGDAERALERYRQIAQRYPEANVDAWIGLCLLELGRPAEAQGNLLRALGRNPDSPVALFGLGRVMLALGEPTVAATYFQRAAADPEWDRRSEPYRRQIAQQVLERPLAGGATR